MGVGKALFSAEMIARTVSASWRYFGWRQAAVSSATMGVFLCSQTTVRLDNLFFPACRHVDLPRPLFIIGHPRSGSTFLHRLLTQTGEFPTFAAWELVCPSLLVHRLAGRAIPRMMERFARTYNQPSGFVGMEAHESSPGAVEEEELLFMLCFDTQFFRLFTPFGFEKQDHQDLIFHDRMPDAVRLASARFFKTCLQRQAYRTGKRQVLAKTLYSTFRVKTLLEVFPDARFIYLVRSPFETIPSHLSLHHAILDRLYGLSNIPDEALRRYDARRYRDDVALYKYFFDLCADGTLREDQYLVIKFEKMRQDLLACFEEIVAFGRLDVGEELRHKVREAAARQKTYKRRHRNLDLAAFGLTLEQIEADLGFVFDAYGLDRNER